MNNSIKVKIALLEAGLSQADIARDLKVHRSQVNHVIQNRRRDRHIEEYIEDRCGKNRGELFPVSNGFGGPAIEEPERNEKLGKQL